MANSFISAQELITLKQRQQMIADDVVNMEYDYEEDQQAAESDYFAGINILYAELGENAPCIDIDPLAVIKLKEKIGTVNPLWTRREVLVKLGNTH